MTKPKDPLVRQKPGPKKSQATVEREKRTALQWTQKCKIARDRYVNTPYLPSWRQIALDAKTTIEIVKRWAYEGNWELLRLHRQIQLTESALKEKGFDLETVHMGCLSLYVEAINTSGQTIVRERRKFVPNFEAIRQAIATAAQAEEQIRKIYQWMPTVEHRMIMRDLIAESAAKTRDMLKEYLGTNEPLFADVDTDDKGTD